MGIVKLSTAGILDYQKYSSALAGNTSYSPTVLAYDLLETVNVGSGGQATITFSSLNTSYGSTYQHLQIRWTGRAESTNGYRDTYMKFNGDATAGNYKAHWLRGNGSTVTSGAINGEIYGFRVFDLTDDSATSGIFSAGVIDILDPFETTKNTTVRQLYGSSGGRTEIILVSGLWTSTAALTSITFEPYTYDFTQYSRLSLYGLKAA